MPVRDVDVVRRLGGRLDPVGQRIRVVVHRREAGYEYVVAELRARGAARTHGGYPGQVPRSRSRRLLSIALSFIYGRFQHTERA